MCWGNAVKYEAECMQLCTNGQLWVTAKSCIHAWVDSRVASALDGHDKKQLQGTNVQQTAGIHTTTI